MRYRLRYLQHDLELTEGQFVIGRSAACQLSLDDPLVSRRHAVLTLAGETVTIDDEQSRNGILVNGKRIAGRTSLGPGDRIVIGSQEMTLLGPHSKQSSETDARLAGKQTLTRLPAEPDDAIDATPVGSDVDTRARSAPARASDGVALTSRPRWGNRSATYRRLAPIRRSASTTES